MLFADRGSAEELQMDGRRSQKRDEQGIQFCGFTDPNNIEVGGEYDDEYEFEYDGADEIEGFEDWKTQQELKKPKKALKPE